MNTKDEESCTWTVPSSSECPKLWKTVTDLSEKAIVEVYLPLLKVVFSKGDVIRCLHNLKKINVDHPTRILLLTVLTDYVVSAIVDITPVDIFNQDVTDKSKNYIMEIICKEWRTQFLKMKNCKHSYYKNIDVSMKTLMTFLSRMRNLLVNLRYHKLSIMLTSTIDECLWIYNLQDEIGRNSIAFTRDLESNGDKLPLDFKPILSSSPKYLKSLETSFDSKSDSVTEMDYDLLELDISLPEFELSVQDADMNLSESYDCSLQEIDYSFLEVEYSLSDVAKSVPENYIDVGDLTDPSLVILDDIDEPLV